MLVTTALDYSLARAIENSRDNFWRKFFLWLSIVSNISVLAYFKYFNFFIETGHSSLKAFGFLTPAKAPVFNIILPIGISFYTLQSLSYVIDVYRGQLSGKRSLVELLAAVSFFPHLIAGPIIRAAKLLPQFAGNASKMETSMVRSGLMLFAFGLLKKGLGDMLGAHADPVFFGARNITTIDAWTGTLAFTGQLFADFSGYMDMAIGSALLMGFKLPDSFNLPYFARDPLDFWRRWNISLSNWFRDYVYVPLGGKLHHHNRNLFLTMLLSGLWHGAAWNFVLWGAYYGVLSILTNEIQKRSPTIKDGRQNWPGLALRIGLTFYLVNIGTAIFRTSSLETFKQILFQMHSFSETPAKLQEYYALLFVLLALVFCHGLDYLRRRLEPNSRENLSWAITGAVFGLAIAANGTSNPFIYFQF